jgi:hypothetical protein
MVYSLFNPLIISLLFFGKNILSDGQCGLGQVYYKNKCVSCPNGCAECSPNNVNLLPCKKCFCPAMLEKGMYCVRHDNDYNPSQCHLITCPGQDYFINNRYNCQKCGYGCKICDNANTCLKCHCLYTKINKQCFASVGTLNYENCDENEYNANLRCRSNEFNKNGKCQQCAPICKTCTKTQTTCTSCKKGYKFFANNNTCVDGNYLDIKFINIILLISILLF